MVEAGVQHDLGFHGAWHRYRLEELEMNKGKSKGNGGKNAKKKELAITQIFNAPRERVWTAWTDPEQIKRWWGPKIFTSPYCKIDRRVAGKFLFCMRWPDGRENWNTGASRNRSAGGPRLHRFVRTKRATWSRLRTME
jgi:Activator of Hsp90 ATPase homolog 1-like protein